MDMDMVSLLQMGHDRTFLVDITPGFADVFSSQQLLDIRNSGIGPASAGGVDLSSFGCLWCSRSAEYLVLLRHVHYIVYIVFTVFIVYIAYKVYIV